MFELLKTAITGVNIIPTTLLGLAVLYWIIVILGAIDIDAIDFDADMDASDAGFIQGLLGFLNMKELPFMLVYSIITLIFWVLSMLMHLLPFETGGMSAILLLPNLFISILASKTITYPLKNVFGDAFKDKQTDEDMVGKLCTLLCDLSLGRLGQAEVDNGGTSLIINVKVDEDESLQKGDKALIISKDKEKHFYIIKKFQGVR